MSCSREQALQPPPPHVRPDRLFQSHWCILRCVCVRVHACTHETEVSAGLCVSADIALSRLVMSGGISR